MFQIFEFLIISLVGEETWFSTLRHFKGACQDTCTLPSWVWYSLHRTYLLLHFGSRSKRVHQGRESKLHVLTSGLSAVSDC